MGVLSFTPAERRALLFLLLLLATGSGVQIWKRYFPGAISTYVVEVDTLTTAVAAAGEHDPARRLERGIDPNRAGPEDLELLPGVGPALARAIVSDRERNGPYRTADDLLRVPGIGARTLARLRPFLTFP